MAAPEAEAGRERAARERADRRVAGVLGSAQDRAGRVEPGSRSEALADAFEVPGPGSPRMFQDVIDEYVEARWQDRLGLTRGFEHVRDVAGEGEWGEQVACVRHLYPRDRSRDHRRQGVPGRRPRGTRGSVQEGGRDGVRHGPGAHRSGPGRRGRPPPASGRLGVCASAVSPAAAGARVVRRGDVGFPPRGVVGPVGPEPARGGRAAWGRRGRSGGSGRVSRAQGCGVPQGRLALFGGAGPAAAARRGAAGRAGRGSSRRKFGAGGRGSWSGRERGKGGRSFGRTGIRRRRWGAGW